MNSQISRRSAKLLLPLLPILLFYGCSSETPTDTNSGTTSSAPTLTDLWDRGLNNCANLCHEPGGTQADGPDMSSKDNFHANVVGKSANDYPAWIINSTCARTLKMINAGDAGSSSIMAAQNQAQSDAFLISNQCISSYNIHQTFNITFDSGTFSDDLATWINAGAANN